MALCIVMVLGILAGCGQKGNDTPKNDDNSTALSGSVSTNGSTSMEKVIGALSEQFMADNSGVSVTYDPTGSGTGIEAAKNGTYVVIGGSKGDDIATYDALLEELGITEDQMSYITYDSTGDAITAALGGNLDFVISKPASASQYVESGDLTPTLALSTERFTGNLADAPTLSEIGDYENVEVPVWRGVAAPAAMSDAAVEFWTEALQKVSETQAWNDEYLVPNQLISQYMNSTDATAYVSEYEADYMATNGLS